MPDDLSEGDLRALVCYLVYRSNRLTGHAGLTGETTARLLASRYGLIVPLRHIHDAFQRLRRERMLSKKVWNGPDFYYARHDNRSKPGWLTHRYIDRGLEIDAAMRPHGIARAAPPPEEPRERPPIEPDHVGRLHSQQET